MLKGDRQIPTQWLRPLDLAIQREQRQTTVLKGDRQIPVCAMKTYKNLYPQIYTKG